MGAWAVALQETMAPLTHTTVYSGHPERVEVYGPAFSKKTREFEDHAWLSDMP